jgi:ABC-type sugar transport system permease subunit
VNGVLKLIGLGKIRFLSDPNLNLIVLMVCIIWKTIPFAFIVLLSGMQAIPNDYYEAAEIDGGSTLAKTRYITIPFLMGHFRILAVVITIGLLGGVDVMRTIGGTGDFKVIGYAMYLQAFSSAGLSYGAAIGAIMLVIAILLTLIYSKFLNLNALRS